MSTDTPEQRWKEDPAEIQKRDELLAQKKIEILAWCDRNQCDSDSIHEWLKQYEELKRESEHIKISNHILEQSRVRGYPTAMEWNALVNQVKKVVR